ncbi:MAG TPA: glycosyltransferase [Clostridia bacterium]|nr:glycosyltransferase [Clostridia bacterium]
MPGDKNEHRPTVSVVLLAYNQLEYTKKCVESLLRHTSDVVYELITINNGSSDGTEEYFNSLSNEKKISFLDNIGVDKAVNYGFRLAEGKYTLNLSNDIVVTPRWLKNLVVCAESDEKIGMVVPVCNFSSNYQTVNLPYSSLEKLDKITELYNRTNPALWEERLRLITYTCLFRTDLQKAIGGFDEDFNPGAYDDDAISFTIRRKGYKLMLVKDTYVHHFGSITFGAEYAKNNLAARNRALFIKKFNVDPWGATMIDTQIVALADYGRKKEVKILGVGQSCGASLLQIKNGYRTKGVSDVTLYYLSEEVYNLADLATICETYKVAPPNEVKQHFGQEKYDLVVVESETDKLRNLEAFYSDLCGMTKPGGRIITTAAKYLLPTIEQVLAHNGFIRANSLKEYYFAFDNTIL